MNIKTTISFVELDVPERDATPEKIEEYVKDVHKFIEDELDSKHQGQIKVTVEVID